MQLTMDHLDWAKRYVRQVTGGNAIDLEDLAQEGFVAMWVAQSKAEQAGRTINEGYLKQAARWAILNVLHRRHPALPLDPSELPEDQAPPVDVDIAAHRREILAAVDELPQRQREYVYLRFWAGLSTKTELNPSTGFSTGLWYRPRTGARDVLRRKLAHLADHARN